MCLCGHHHILATLPSGKEGPAIHLIGDLMDPELVYTLLGKKKFCSPVTILIELFQLPCKFTVFTRTLSGNFSIPHLVIVHKDVFCVGI